MSLGGRFLKGARADHFLRKYNIDEWCDHQPTQTTIATRGVSARTPYPSAFHTLSSIRVSCKSINKSEGRFPKMDTESRAWSLCARKLSLPIFPIPIIPFATRRGGVRSGELGRFGGTIGGATFLGNRGRLFLERAGIPLATGGLRGILILQGADRTSRGWNGVRCR